MTVGSPPIMTAMTELVVPRSIPRIFPMMSSSYALAGHAHQRGAQHPFANFIALLNHFNNLAALMVSAVFLGDGLMNIGVKIALGGMRITPSLPEW
jgi:hypothetical protein